MVCGNALHLPLAAGTAKCCVTSPPYWGLRDYGVAGQLGLEATPDLYVASMVAVFREVRRVLKDDGVLFLNLGDSYAGSGPSGASYQSETTKRRAEIQADGNFRISKTLGERGLTYAEKKPVAPPGLKPKDLVGIPWRVAFALQADGWWLRSDIIWAKPNPMPESVTDRPTKSHEYVFLLTKSARYYWDAEAVAEEAINTRKPGQKIQDTRDTHGTGGGNAGINNLMARYHNGNPPTSRNLRSVWSIATQPYHEAHFATMPEKLVEPCVLAGSKPGDLVLDPFAGSGTVGVVCRRFARRFVGVELNPAYVGMATLRLAQTQPGLALEATS